MQLYRGIGIGLAVAALGLAGCGKEQGGEQTVMGGKTPQNVKTASATVTGAELDGVAKGNKAFKIALIVKTRNNPFFTPMIDAAEAQAKALGATLEVQAPPQETDKQIQYDMIDTVTGKGVDAILITPADSRGVIPGLKRAQDKGILVLNLDNRIDKDAAAKQNMKLDGYVGANNEAGGKLAGESMVEALKGAGNVAIIGGIPDADNAQARQRGFKVGIGTKLKVVSEEIANWDMQQAEAKTNSILAVHKDLNGIFCANDKMALGAISAINAGALKGKVTVVGYDNIAAVQPYLKSGEMYATIEQHPDYMGKYGVRMAIGILNGKVKKGGEYLVALDVKKKP